MNRKTKSKKPGQLKSRKTSSPEAEPDSISFDKADGLSSNSLTIDDCFSLTGLIISLVVAGAFVYVPAFDAPFVLDSIPHIEQNTQIRELSSLQWYGIQRGIAYLSFAVDYAIYGNSPWGFQLTNLVIHILNAILIYVLVDQTARIALSSSDTDIRFRRRFAFLGAMVWFVHPLQTQGVIYHVQRMESLMSLFFLLTLYAIHRFVVGRQNWAWLVFAFFCCLAAINTKQVGYVIPMVGLTYAYVFGKDISIKRQKLALLAVGAIVVVAFGYVALSFWSGNQMGGSDQRATKSLEYLATQTQILFFYLKLIVWPVGQNVDHAWPYVSSLTQAVIPGLILAIVFVLGCWMTLKRKPLGWCILSFFLILGPTSSLLPISDLAVEHRMYLPSLMVILPLTFAICWFFRNSSSGQLSVVFGLIVVLCFASHLRCQVWRSKQTLWADSVAGAPLNPRAHSNLAIAYAQQSNFKRAIPSFERALELVESPQLKIETSEVIGHATLLKRLGTVCLKAGELKKAETYFLRWSEIEGVYYYEFLDIANQLFDAGRSRTAIALFKKALELAKANDEKAFVLVEYGHVFLNSGDPKTARKLFDKAVEFNDKNWKAHNNLGISIMSTDQDIELAHKHFSKAVMHSNQTPEAMMNLARVKELMRANEEKAMD